MKVTLAIPNYNGAQNLKELLTQVTKENFAHIYVLDDKSTDNSQEIVNAFSNVSFIQGSENLGPAGNRNRILAQLIGDVIMFLDVDMTLQTTNIVEKIQKNFMDKKIAVVGGLILTKKLEPMWWNYGFEMHPVRDAKADIVHTWALDNWHDKNKINELREKYMTITHNLDISFGEAKTKQVDWVSEANFCIRTSIFRELNGFDAEMRYHADQDLCRRVRQKGYAVIHSPDIKAIHLEIDTVGEARNELDRKNKLYFYKKHWNMPEYIFELLFPKD